MKTIRELIDKCWDLIDENKIDGGLLPCLDNCEEEFLEAETELKKLRVADVSVSDCILNNEYNHFMDIDIIGACTKCGSMKQYGH